MKRADEAGLTTALEESIGRNDAGDEAARHEALRERFVRTRTILTSGGAACLEQTEDDLALELIGPLIQLLRSGAADRLILDMLADFLSSIKDSERAIVRRVLQLKTVPKGRSSNDLERIRAIEAFQLWTNEGHSEETAMMHAYNAYHGYVWVRKHDKEVLVGRYEIDSKRSSSFSTSNGEVVQSNEAEKFIESTIRPLLRAAGLLAAKPRGRPGKSPKK